MLAASQGIPYDSPARPILTMQQAGITRLEYKGASARKVVSEKQSHGQEEQKERKKAPLYPAGGP